MLQTRFKNTPTPQFLDVFDDLFGKGIRINEGYTNGPSVNIIETAKEFKIQVAAPGLEKKDFNVEIEERKLTISSVAEIGKVPEGDVYRKRQFSIGKFKRIFTLPERIDEDAIIAKYSSGILVLTIPKLEKVKDLKQIKIN
jgi:HSP20 family protein